MALVRSPINIVSALTFNGAAIGGSGAPGGIPRSNSIQQHWRIDGFTASGDATINTGTGAVAVTKTGGAGVCGHRTVTYRRGRSLLL